jgi:hypothetical protein
VKHERKAAVAGLALLALAGCDALQTQHYKNASRRLAAGDPAARQARGGEPGAEGTAAPQRPRTVMKYWDRAATQPKHELTTVRAPDGRELRHGVERAWYANGQLEYERHYASGEQVGVWRTWYANGQRRSEVCVSGEELTMLRWWYENGQLETEGPARGGVREGRWTHWYPSGVVQSQGDMLAGRRHGEWVEFAEDGSVTARGAYEHGGKVGTWEYPSG